jgi:hypothetical protein
MSERTRSRLSRADRPARTIGSRLRADAVAIVIAISAVIAVGLLLLNEPARVDTITFSNASNYDVGIDVSSGDQRSWLPVAVVDVGTTRAYSDVLDQGDTWVFRFRAQGVDGGEVTIARDELAASGWKVAVPNDVIERLQAAGAPASACLSAACRTAG